MEKIVLIQVDGVDEGIFYEESRRTTWFRCNEGSKGRKGKGDYTSGDSEGRVVR